MLFVGTFGTRCTQCPCSAHTVQSCCTAGSTWTLFQGPLCSFPWNTVWAHTQKGGCSHASCPPSEGVLKIVSWGIGDHLCCDFRHWVVHCNDHKGCRRLDESAHVVVSTRSMYWTTKSIQSCLKPLKWSFSLCCSPKGKYDSGCLGPGVLPTVENYTPTSRPQQSKR